MDFVTWNNQRRKLLRNRTFSNSEVALAPNWALLFLTLEWTLGSGILLWRKHIKEKNTEENSCNDGMWAGLRSTVPIDKWQISCCVKYVCQVTHFRSKGTKGPGRDGICSVFTETHALFPRFLTRRASRAAHLLVNNLSWKPFVTGTAVTERQPEPQQKETSFYLQFQS